MLQTCFQLIRIPILARLCENISLHQLEYHLFIFWEFASVLYSREWTFMIKILGNIGPKLWPDHYVNKSLYWTPWKILLYVEKVWFTGVYIVFSFWLKNKDSGYSLEPLHSNEYPQSVLGAKLRKMSQSTIFWSCWDCFETSA